MTEGKQWQERWEFVLRLSSETGQGTVDLVRDKTMVTDDKTLAEKVIASVQGFGHARPDRRKQSWDQFREAILEIIQAENAEHLGALKKLHDPQNARDPERAPERMRREIKVMCDVSHPNLLRILDSNVDELWYVSEFHPGGTLDKNTGGFTGNVRATLDAFRPLVEGVASFHLQNVIHRDVKTENIFISTDGRLVLGDFGLVFSADDDAPRLSATGENTGTRYWMPHWYEGSRSEDVKPDFDVFGLAKILWAMLSGKQRLPHWYFSKPEFDLCVLHPDVPEMKNINEILAKCLVVEPEDCLPDANALLREIDVAKDTMIGKPSALDDDIERNCTVCGKGVYRMYLNRNGDIHNFGWNPAGGVQFKIFTCDYCGHLQTFLFRPNDTLMAWRNETVILTEKPPNAQK